MNSSFWEIFGRLIIPSVDRICAPTGSMSPAEIEDFAIDHGWRVVSRLGGRQIEFYNDASARDWMIT